MCIEELYENFRRYRFSVIVMLDCFNFKFISHENIHNECVQQNDNNKVIISLVFLFIRRCVQKQLSPIFCINNNMSRNKKD